MLRTLGVIVVSFAILGTFMALDRTVGHWYVPESRASTTNEVARELLGIWDRDAAQSEREEALNDWVRGVTSSEAPPGSVNQFKWALLRLANAGALPLVGEEMSRLSSPRQRLERLYECMGYLLATHGTASACNMVAIRE